MPALPMILLDDIKTQRMLCFMRPLGVISAWKAEEVEGALTALEAALAAGQHAAGYCSYELGLALEPRLCPLLSPKQAGPLLWFGLFEGPELVEGAEVEARLARMARGRAYAGPLRHDWDASAYQTRFVRARDWIAAGDIYQVNLSFRARFDSMGDPLALYRALRAGSGAAHAAYVDDGVRQILSLSPESFFTADRAGRIVARPMKGTYARGPDPAADDEARAALLASVKDRAENLMIVDLIRNDLSRVASDVAVEELFGIETYPTLHQMVSTVTAQLNPETGPRALLQALFPCGSITGAPKIRAMQIIAELEYSSRGAYCGAIGMFAPDGCAQFNVAIRTLTIADGKGELGIGGAIVTDSKPDGEYAECLLKARFFEAARRPLCLIETLRYEPNSGCVRLGRHLARMQASARQFGLPFDRAGAELALGEAVRGAAQVLRVRLTLDEEGHFAVTAAPLEPAPAAWRYSFAGTAVCSSDVLLRHKTDWREIYDEAYAARPEGCDEVLFRNERGELTEGSRTNLFAVFDGRLVSPPLECGVLDGVLRRELIESGRCTEAILQPADLVRAERIYLGNSLRGLIAAEAAAKAESSATL